MTADGGMGDIFSAPIASYADLAPGGGDEDRLVQRFSELCRALPYVHSQGVVHRDVKLNDILLAPERRACLLNFGISI